MKTTPASFHGLHHVTAVTAQAQANLDFYTQILGLRLVKKTVNQDDVSAYHLFYADALGSPGTDLTFFDWAHIARTRHGADMISETALRLRGDESALALWAQWFTRNSVSHRAIETVAGLPTLSFEDGEGQRLRLIADSAPGGADAFHPWKGSPVPIEHAIIGLGAVTLTVRDTEPTARVLTEVLGFRPSPQYPTLFETGDGGPGAQLHLVGSNTRGTHGAGGVHHVAWRVRDEHQLLAWQKHIEGFGLGTSGEVDRHYFRSLYFRIPGGILFEIATDGPGFTADGEPAEHLGEHLALPPFLEPRRAAIEAGIKPLVYSPVKRS